jgi:hypothetical protein
LDISGTPTTGVQIDIDIIKFSSGSTVKWLRGVPIPVAATLQVVEGTKQVLKTGDIVRVTCLTSGETVDVNGSYVNGVNL